MADGGADIAVLGLRVDARQFVSANKALDEFTAAGGRAEKQAESFGRTATQAAKVSAVESRNAARAQVDAMEREFQVAQASIKDAVARGLMTPKEAERHGREAAIAFNQGLIRTIDQTTHTALNRNTKAGAAAFVDLTNNFKNVDQAGRKAGLGLGRLNDSMVQVVRQTTGLNSISGRLLDTVGTFAIGTAYMVPVLAGLAAIGAWFSAATAEAREFKARVDEAKQSLLEAARVRALGLGGEAGQQLADLQKDRSRTAALLGAAEGLGNQSLAKKYRDDLEEADKAIKEAQQQIFETVTREQERINTERERGNTVAARTADESVRIEREKAQELERLAAEQARREQASSNLAASLEIQLDAERRLLNAQREGKDEVEAVNRELAREEAVREALATATDKDRDRILALVDALHDLRAASAAAARTREEAAQATAQATSAEFESTLGALDEWNRRQQDLADQAARFRDAWVFAAVDIASAFGDAAGRAASFAEALFTSGPAAIPAFLAGGISSILDSRANRAQAVEDARREFERVLDAYVDELADGSRWEQLEADAAKGAREAFDALLETMFADLASLGDFGAKAAQEIKDAINAGLDAEGIGDVLKQFGPEGQRILDAYLDHLKAIDEQRKEEIKSQEDEIAVRMLIAQGRDEEAEALRRQIEEQATLAAAAELGGEALADLWRELFKVEEAARAAAKAAEEEAEAKRRAETRSDFASNLSILQAQNSGDDFGAFVIGQEVAAAEQIANARKLFDQGIIDQAMLDAFIEAVGINLTRAIHDAADAAMRAAEAEAFRAQQDMDNLNVRLLMAQGASEEAFLLRQRMEVEDALFQQRSEEYIALLLMVQAEERAARERQRQARAMQEQQRALEESTKSIEGMSRALNGPAGLVLALRRFQTIQGAGAPNALGIKAPTYQGQAGVTIGTVNINGANKDGAQLFDEIIAAAKTDYRAGAGNRFTVLPV